MFSLFKKNKDKEEVPEWASFFNKAEYNEFLGAIKQYFYSINVVYTMGDGMIDIGPNDFGFSKLGLVNVAQVCKLDDQRNYKEIVKEHFDGFARINKFDKDFQTIIDDYEKIKEYLGVRLYPADYASSIGKDLTVGKDFAGDIYAMLIFDLPDSVSSIRPEQAEKWNKSFDELFEIGIKNIRDKYPLEISGEQLGEFKIWFVQGDHFFSPNVVFDYAKMQELSGFKGALVGIPHRHAVIIYPIDDLKVVNAITGTIQTVKGMNEQGPGSISSNLFWYFEGRFYDLPYEFEDGKIQFSPPEEFVTMLNELKGEE